MVNGDEATNGERPEMAVQKIEEKRWEWTLCGGGAVDQGSAIKSGRRGRGGLDVMGVGVVGVGRSGLCVVRRFIGLYVRDKIESAEDVIGKGGRI